MKIGDEFTLDTEDMANGFDILTTTDDDGRGWIALRIVGHRAALVMPPAVALELARGLMELAVDLGAGSAERYVADRRH